MANLAINENDARNIYTSTGESVFSYTFPVKTTDDIRVSVDQVDLVYATDFTFTGLGDASGGDVTITAGTTSGEVVAIWLELPIKRETGFTEGAAVLTAEALNNEMVERTRVDQMLRSEVHRAIRLEPDDPTPGTGMTLGANDAAQFQYIGRDLGGGLAYATESISTTVPLTADLVGQYIYPQTTEELNAGITPTNYEYPQGNVRRYGIVPDSSGAASDNTTALRALCDNTIANGPKGKVVFEGGSIWYFNDRISCRDDLHFDLGGSTLNFTKTGDANDTDGGAIHALRNFSIRNGKIVVNYTYTAGTNTFNALEFGGRNSSAVDFGELFEINQPAPFGNIVVQNIDITRGQTEGKAILMFGGLENVLIENVVIDGEGTASRGIEYEFGFWEDETLAQDQFSTHANNITLKNVVVRNIEDTAGTAIRFAGVYNLTLENINVKGSYTGIEITPGESLNYQVHELEHQAGRKRNVTMKNIVMSEVESTGIVVKGAQEISSYSGYLSPLTIADQDHVDLYDFTLDGFSLVSGYDSTTLATGVRSSAGTTVIRNGFIDGAIYAITLDDDAVNFSIEGVTAVNCTSLGFRLNFSGAVTFSPVRRKTGIIRACKIAGTVGQAIAIDHAENVLIENNRFGYELAHDGVAEADQTAAVSVGAEAHVVCRNNYVAGNVGTYAYSGISGGEGHLFSPRGIRTVSTHWQWEGVGVVSLNLDSSPTLTPGTSSVCNVSNTVLTANRAVTFDSTDAADGETFEINHTVGGAFTIDFGGLVTSGSGVKCAIKVRYDSPGGVWVIVSYSEWT